MTVEVPIRTVSETNAHEHWRHRQKRAKCQRQAVAMTVGRLDPALRPPVVVTLTRIAPRELDKSNNVGALKHVQDEVASLLGVDDRHPGIVWRYRQAKSPEPKYYAVRIRIERASGPIDTEQVGLRIDPFGSLVTADGKIILEEAPAQVRLWVIGHSVGIGGEEIAHYTLNDRRLRRIEHTDGTVSWDLGSAEVPEVVRSFREIDKRSVIAGGQP